VAASVPDSESLRRAALQASWQRGRWIARRRLWWRWTVWVLLRYVLPAVAVLALMGGLAYGWSLLKSGSSDAPMEPATAPAIAAPVPPPETEPDAAPEPAANASLRLDWAAPARNTPKTSPTSASSPASTTTTNVGDSRP
jgi:hypothetical protein